MKGVALLAIFALGGCAAVEPIKAYEGPARPKAELAIVESAFERDWVSVADVQIAAVDSAQLSEPGAPARRGIRVAAEPRHAGERPLLRRIGRYPGAG